MSGKPKIEIIESVETLKKLMNKQKKVLDYKKVLTLYLLKSKQVETIRGVAQTLGKGEATIHRWIKLYKQGGIDHLLKERKPTGRPKKISL